MEFRYHPIIEGLKCNEDGTEIWLHDQKLNIREQKLPHTRKPRHVVNIIKRTVATTRLVLECWQGMAENISYAARRYDEQGGDHYTNLYWGRRGRKGNRS